MLEYFMIAGVGQPQEAGRPDEAVCRSGTRSSRSAAPCSTTASASAAARRRCRPSCSPRITVPMLCLGSTGSPDWLRAGAEAAARPPPTAGSSILEGDFHTAPASVLAPVLAEHHRR